jgi:hypothetical protein
MTTASTRGSRYQNGSAPGERLGIRLGHDLFFLILSGVARVRLAAGAAWAWW